MKKKILICLCICSLIGVSASAFAADVTSSQTGTTVTVGAAPTQLTYNASPSVSVSVIASTTAYSIMAANILTDTTNGLQYGTLSTATGYAQGPKTTDSGSDLTTNGPSTTGQSSTAIATDVTWTWMGGS